MRLWRRDRREGVRVELRSKCVPGPDRRPAVCAGVAKPSFLAKVSESRLLALRKREERALLVRVSTLVGTSPVARRGRLWTVSRGEHQEYHHKKKREGQLARVRGRSPSRHKIWPLFSQGDRRSQRVARAPNLPGLMTYPRVARSLRRRHAGLHPVREGAPLTHFCSFSGPRASSNSAHTLIHYFGTPRALPPPLPTNPGRSDSDFGHFQGLLGHPPSPRTPAGPLSTSSYNLEAVTKR